MDSEFSRRAAERRQRLEGGVARSFEELEEASRRYWRDASPEAKLKAVHDAIFEAWIVGGKRGPAPRFDGSTWGILEFER